MRLVVAGTPSVALPSLDALIGSARHEVVAVVTRPDAPAGRGRHLTASPVKQRALEAGIEVLTPVKPSEPDFLDRLRSIAPDCCPVIAYGALLPQAALDIPVHGWVNLHFSILPAWRGAAPVQHALLAGDDVTGASTFEIEAGLDSGPIYGVMTATIGARDTAGDLLERLARDGADLLTATLDGIEDGELVPVPQPEDGITIAPKLTATDARIDWSRPATTIDRRIRACTPAPGAWTALRGKRVGLGPVMPVAASDAEGAIVPGRVGVSRVGGGRELVVVGTGSGAVVLGDVRPAGQQPMPASDWARGLRLGPDERFE